jgi:hypothetical protein
MLKIKFHLQKYKNYIYWTYTLFSTYISNFCLILFQFIIIFNSQK